MARKKIDIKKIIKVYLKKFPKDIKVKGVFLFGSYVREEAGKHSDVDIIIISPDFKKLPFLKRLELLSHIYGSSDVSRLVPMDILGYTPEEFKEIDKESIVMKEAKKEGKMIYKAPQ